MTIHHNNAADDWRDLVDDLTASEVAQLERWEASWSLPDKDRNGGLLLDARRMISDRLLQDLYGDIAPPRVPPSRAMG